MKGRESKKKGKNSRIQDPKAAIPLYLNGELDSKESQELETLLDRDTELQKELAELSEMKAVLRESRMKYPEPSPHIFEKILEGIEGKQTHTVVNKFERLFQFLNHLLRQAFASPRLAWALAGILLVVSVGLGIHAYHETRYLTLSIQQESIGTGVVINVVFQGEARLKKVETLLRELNARIIGGPYRRNLYVLVIKREDVRSALEKARRSPLVRYIEPAVPGSFGEGSGARSGGGGG